MSTPSNPDDLVKYVSSRILCDDNVSNMHSSRLFFRVSSHSSSMFANLRKLRGFRMNSTLVGASGREYVRDKLLRSHPRNAERNIYLAQ